MGPRPQADRTWGDFPIVVERMERESILAALASSGAKVLEAGVGDKWASRLLAIPLHEREGESGEERPGGPPTPCGT